MLHYKPALYLLQDFLVYHSKRIKKASGINFCSQVRKEVTFELATQGYFDSGSYFLICPVVLLDVSSYHSTTLNVYVFIT